MALRVYRSFPFVPGSEIGLVNTYTGDGTTTEFLLVNNTSVTTGDTIQADLVYYSRPLGGFTYPDLNHFELSSPPASNSQILATSTSPLEYPGFDQVQVDGAPDPANVIEQRFYVADDGTELTTTIHDSQPGQIGVGILFSNLVTAAGAQVSWMQLACANAAGDALTYQATGTTLYTAKFAAFSTLSASAIATTTSLQIASASGFYAGDFITINPGGGSEEDVQITSIASNTLTISGTNFPHYEGEFVFVRGRGFWSKCTIPVNALGGVAGNLINLALTCKSAKVSRL